MNRSHSLTGPQLAKVNEYKAQGYVIDPTKSSESVEMTKGARRIAICWNGLVKALGAGK
tara:strand:+ start:10963 stop:11139 length:177 start_codon:yes stop_codon:yes gene_type:complete